MAKLALAGTIEVTPGRKDQLMAALLAHRDRCLGSENGTLQMDVLMPRDDETTVLLYEVYQDDAASGDEIVYVDESSLEYALDGKSPVTVKAGESLFIPAGAIHAVKNVGTGNAAELATYIVEKGKPLLTQAK